MNKEHFNQTVNHYQPRDRVGHKSDPWNAVQLTKAERKGKTPDQIRKLREGKYREADI